MLLLAVEGQHRREDGVDEVWLFDEEVGARSQAMDEKRAQDDRRRRAAGRK